MLFKLFEQLRCKEKDIFYKIIVIIFFKIRQIVFNNMHNFKKTAFKEFDYYLLIKIRIKSQMLLQEYNINITY